MTEDTSLLIFVMAWPQATYQMPPGSFALRESEATATNVLTVRKRSDSNKCFNCAKAKRQQQLSAQPERKSIFRFAEEPFNFYVWTQFFYNK
ncbi:hypothetical protein [Lysinibacillus zambalensis]